MLKISHRGASKYEPANTIKAFEKAIELGADCIELDLRVSSDGEVVVFHDEKFKDGQLISDISFSQIKAAGLKEGVDIPLLSEVCAAVAEKAVLDLEIKVEEICPLIKEALKNINKEKIIISSFDEYVLRDIKKELPGVRTGILADSILLNILGVMESAKADILVQRFEYINEQCVRLVHDDNKQIFSWTVNERCDIENMAALGVDGIITDYPERLNNVDDLKEFLL